MLRDHRSIVEAAGLRESTVQITWSGVDLKYATHFSDIYNALQLLQCFEDGEDGRRVMSLRKLQNQFQFFPNGLIHFSSFSPQKCK